MAITSASLADGQLPSSTGALYTATGQTAITCCIVTNTDSSTRTFNIYIKRSGSSDRNVSGKDYSLAAGESANVIDDAQGVRLSSGDAIDGVASVATKLDYFISGVTF